VRRSAHPWKRVHVGFRAASAALEGTANFHSREDSCAADAARIQITSLSEGCSQKRSHPSLIWSDLSSYAARVAALICFSPCCRPPVFDFVFYRCSRAVGRETVATMIILIFAGSRMSMIRRELPRSTVVSHDALCRNSEGRGFSFRVPEPSADGTVAPALFMDARSDRWPR
jgi:hypothetical protein